MKKLYRQRNSTIAGICSGIAKYFDVDDVIIRLIFIILFFTAFPIVIMYFIMWFLIPKEPIDS
jgi:phage shock protein C